MRNKERISIDQVRAMLAATQAREQALLVAEDSFSASQMHFYKQLSSALSRYGGAENSEPQNVGPYTELMFKPKNRRL